METEKFANQLHLLSLLIGNGTLTIDDLAGELKTTRRTIFRYLNLLRDNGFDIRSEHGIHCVTLLSPLFANANDRARLTAAEQDLLAGILRAHTDATPLAASLRTKLLTAYGLDTSHAADTAASRLNEARERLARAIRERRCAVLTRYCSPNSGTTADRLVEPFRLLSEGREVRCYEPASDTCKTFKLTRIAGPVRLLDQPWQNIGRHHSIYTDIFGFTAENVHRVTLRIGPLATRMLIEEYGVAEDQMPLDTDGRHRVVMLTVCSYQGLARFVLGLISDITVVRGNEFRAYLRRITRDALRELSGDDKN